MVRNANLKRAVRARMKATGENYTVALRAVVAERERDNIMDAYQIPPELRHAWDAIKEGDDD